MLKRPFAAALGAALLFVLAIPITATAIDLLTDMGGFPGLQITGLRDTFVSKTGTDTVTGTKTFSGTVDLTGTFKINGTTVAASAAEINTVADVSARMVTITGSGAMTAAVNGDRINLLAEVGGDALLEVTLPEATGTGNRYKFYIGVVNTSNYIISALTTDTMSGSIGMLQDSGGGVFAYLAMGVSGTHDRLTLNGTTTGGVRIGDWIELVDCLDTTWCVMGVLTGSGTENTPASTS